MIEPRKDAYGAEADTSHLADYLELLALAGTPLPQPNLADYLADLGWPVRSRELYYSPGEGGPEEEPSEDDEEGGTDVPPSEEAAQRVFDLLSDRETLLGPLYPFEIDGERLLLKTSIDDSHNAYLRLLAITVAHHYHDDVESDAAAEQVFESVVAEAMADRGLETCDMGAAGRDATDFREAVEVAGDAIRMAASPDAASSKENANEEGVDTVSHMHWGDRRPGHWVFIGQATCGKSDSWRRKIAEPKPPQWGKLMGSLVLPLAYLAVPHHVEDDQLLHLTEGDGRLVLDRLRLCRHISGGASADDELVEAVKDAGVFSPLNV